MPSPDPNYRVSALLLFEIVKLNYSNVFISMGNQQLNTVDFILISFILLVDFFFL